VVSCTAAEVADFVRYARDNGYLEDTNIVILGDHLSRKNPVTPKLSQLQDRTIFNRFISQDMPAPNRKQLLHFDLMPSILEFTGYKVAGGAWRSATAPLTSIRCSRRKTACPTWTKICLIVPSCTWRCGRIRRITDSGSFYNGKFLMRNMNYFFKRKFFSRNSSGIFASLS
jgi:hypothetical protein